MATQLISQEEADNLRPLPFGRKHPVRMLIEQLKPGQILQIDRVDFKWRNKTPNFFCLQISKKGKARFEMTKLRHKAGWIVKRVG